MKDLSDRVRLIENILNRCQSAISIRAMLKEQNITLTAFFKILNENAELNNIYKSLIQAQTHELADELLMIPDTYEDTARAKLKSDNIKWLISRRNRKDYGDKIEVDVHQTVDIRAALEQADQRLKEVNPQKISDSDESK